MLKMVTSMRNVKKKTLFQSSLEQRVYILNKKNSTNSPNQFGTDQRYLVVRSPKH